ncbi:MAG: glycosyltransferase family 2 protein, partial [Fimbriiglobus sp.]
ATLSTLGFGYELVLVDDGSRDGTASILAHLAASDAHVVAVHLSRNFGHQPAVTAGLDVARGRAVVVMDGDLQDPPELIPTLVDRWRTGANVVYAVRATRREGPLKRLAYRGFYRLLRAVSDLDIPLDAGDFCLLDRRAADALNRLPERARFVRGLRAFVGFRQVGVSYDRDARHAGTPKYTIRKLFRLAADGLIGFSGFPIRAVAYAGFALLAAAGMAIVGVTVDAIRHGGDVRGWAAVGAVVGAVGGLQLIATGVIGEYVRRVFVEVTGRPPYIVREVLRRSETGASAPGPVPPRPAGLHRRLASDESDAA